MVRKLLEQLFEFAAKTIPSEKIFEAKKFYQKETGEIYEDELRVGEDNLAYVGDTDKLYSGDVLDKYGEKLGTYKKGIKDGSWTEIDYKNGTRRKASYIKGVPEGEQITYVFPGPMDNNKRLEYINYEEGKPVGTWTQWSRDSENRLRKTGEIVFEEGAGRWREWDPNTLVVIRAGDYEGWQRNGLWKSWDAQEVLVSEGEYIGGKKVNKWTWYKDGEDKGWEENYNNGVLDGRFNNLSPYAEIRGVGSFNDGVKTGDWEEYYSSQEGSLERSQTGAYQFGKKVGIWSLYAKNGRRVAEGTYKDNIKEGEWTEGPDIDFGSRFFGRGTYSNNEKSGGWSYVAPRQNPTVEGFFENGKPSGEWKVVYNKKTYKGSLEELKKQVPKLNEFSF